jgi:serine/threonine protein kinase
MVGRFGEVLVLDWGVAKITGMAREFAAAGAPARADTARGAVVGTADYMAPEQASGALDQVDARSDIFSLGRTLAALVAGARPPKRLLAICGKAASPDRDQRYTGALHLSADIERFLTAQPVLAYRETVLERLVRLVSRNQALVLLVAAYLLMRIALFFFARR